MKATYVYLIIALAIAITITLSALVKNNEKPMNTTEAKNHTVTLKTSEGNIVISLNKDSTPKTVENFVELSKKGFYDNTIFHRVINGFMIQGGDPKGDGTGGPGYKFDDEPFEGEYTRGTVAMANSGPNTNGSQLPLTVVKILNQLTMLRFYPQKW